MQSVIVYNNQCIVRKKGTEQRFSFDYKYKNIKLRLILKCLLTSVCLLNVYCLPISSNRQRTFYLIFYFPQICAIQCDSVPSMNQSS